jgi:hypothetical protein
LSDTAGDSLALPVFQSSIINRRLAASGREIRLEFCERAPENQENRNYAIKFAARLLTGELSTNLICIVARSPSATPRAEIAPFLIVAEAE